MSAVVSGQLEAFIMANPKYYLNKPTDSNRQLVKYFSFQ